MSTSCNFIFNNLNKYFFRKNDLRVPKEEWLELPAMAIKCEFWGIDFISNDVTLLAEKLDKIYNQVVVAQVKVIFPFSLENFRFFKNSYLKNYTNYIFCLRKSIKI